jgi:hypothetical protein
MAAGGTTLVDLAVRCDQDGIGCVQCGYFRGSLLFHAAMTAFSIALARSIARSAVDDFC